MWVRINPNPLRKESPDCVVRALCIVLGKTWYEVYDELCGLGRVECDMPSSDRVWGKYLYMNHFRPFPIPEECPECLTVRKFCAMYPKGRYVIGTGSHAVAIINGDYYDSWDSGNEPPSFFWEMR